MNYISILIYMPKNILEKLFEMCNHYFPDLNHQSPRYTSTNHNKKNPPKISFIPIHIKTLHSIFYLEKIFRNVALYGSSNKVCRTYLIRLLPYPKTSDEVFSNQILFV